MRGSLVPPPLSTLNFHGGVAELPATGFKLRALARRSLLPGTGIFYSRTVLRVPRLQQAVDSWAYCPPSQRIPTLRA